MEDSNEQHKTFRVLQYQAQIMRRQRKSLGHRLDQALEQARLLPSARGAGLERVSPSAEETAVGPHGDVSLLYEAGVQSPYEAFQYRAMVLIELLEREVDAHRSKPVFGDAALETQEERDRRLLGYVERGLDPKVIDLLDPAQGGQKAIRRALARLDEAN